MKKLILNVILDKYSDWEIAYLSPLLLALGRDTYEVKTVSLTKDSVRSLGGFTVLPDYDVHTAPAEFEGLILVGGMSWRTEEARQVEPLVQKAQKNNKLLGAICDATVFLGAAGVLNHVLHTSNDLNDLKQWAGDVYAGEEKYVMQPAVRDQKIITANGTAALEFAREVLLALNVAPEEKILDWYNFYKLGAYEAPTPSL
ncbi:MAG: type 1 glutamine amidotransferase family protein [Clostridia bacterium]